MCDFQHNVAMLKEGEEGIVCCIKSSEIALKLMEMGCTPNVKIKVEKPAPLGDPIRIKVADEYTLSLRKEEAELIMLQ